MPFRSPLVVLAIAGLAPVCSLCAQDSVGLARITQTVEYERYLIAQDEAAGSNAVRATAYHEAGSPTGKSSQRKVTPVRDTVAVRLSVVDASAEPLQAADYERLVEQLNATFDFSELEQELERIEFCVAEVSRATSVHRFAAAKESEVLASSPSKQHDFLTRDSLAYEKAFRSVGELTDGRVPSGEAIPIYIVDATDAVLGFASTVPHAATTDVVVVARQLIDGTLPNRSEGRTVAHLVANYLGLKPLWYDETDAGDLIDDTPCHNAANYGKYEGTIHFSLCAGMPRESIDNIMDNTDEEIRSSWTAGRSSPLAWR